jgi:hypothetical protein
LQQQADELRKQADRLRKEADDTHGIADETELQFDFLKAQLGLGEPFQSSFDVAEPAEIFQWAWQELFGRSSWGQTRGCQEEEVIVKTGMD